MELNGRCHGVEKDLLNYRVGRQKFHGIVTAITFDFGPVEEKRVSL